MKRLFVDIDGTLAVWTSTKKAEQLYEQGFFLNLPSHKNMVLAIREICKNKNIEVFILSKYFHDSDYALSEKRLWITKELPEIPTENAIYVPFNENKSDYIPNGLSKDDFLLDDYTVNLLEWKTSGGTGIKCITDINHTNKTWDGAKAYCNQTPKRIAYNLQKIMEEIK